MHIVADRIYDSEPCWGLTEQPELRPQPDGSIQHRWIQRLWVIRGDRKAKFETDFGPASDWPDATPVIYPSFGENTVGQLQWLAERDRHSDKWAKRRKEMRAESTLIADILRQEEALIEWKGNRSQFGSYQSTQRIDFPREAVRQQKKERLANARSRRKRTQN